MTLASILIPKYRTYDLGFWPTLADSSPHVLSCTGFGINCKTDHRHLAGMEGRQFYACPPNPHFAIKIMVFSRIMYLKYCYQGDISLALREKAYGLDYTFNSIKKSFSFLKNIAVTDLI